MATRPSFMNRGSYKWIPDYYGSTTEQDFGVTKAYYAAVIDYGRPHNVLPEGTGGYASGTSVWGNRVRLSKTGAAASADLITDAATPLPIPFYRSLMRSLSTTLETLPNPEEDEGIGLSSVDAINNAGDPPFILFTVDDIGNGRTASLLIDYALLTSEEYAGNFPGATSVPTPVRIVGLYDKNTVGSWYDLSRTTGDGGSWGPASAEDPAIGAAVDKARSLLGIPGLIGTYLPLPFKDASGNDTSIPEFVITQPAQYTDASVGGVPGDATKQPWGVKATRTVSIRTCRRYFTASDYFPRLKAILIMPNTETVGGVAPGLAHHWNFMVSRIRFYDAIQANVVPEHTEEKEDKIVVVEPQMPCMIFGYAWRIAHPVQLSKNTPVIQPSIGTVMPALGPALGAYGNARRAGTFKFKFYHPDIEGLGVAHSVRFYYGLAVMAIPGTTPGFNSSLIGLMTEMLVDFDLLLVQYMGPLPGHQSLTFVPSTSQMHETEVGRIAYGGVYGYSRQTVGLRCYHQDGSRTSPPSLPTGGTLGGWTPIAGSTFPSSDPNGVRPLWYDVGDRRLTYYTFLSMDAHAVTAWNPNVPSMYAGGFSPVDRGGPQTHLNGKGAFHMTTSTSSTFGGIDRTTAYSKVKAVPHDAVLDVSSWNDMDSHLATFASDVRNIGSSAQIFTGNWRVQFAAWMDDSSRHDVQIVYRFAFVDASVPDDELNGNALWAHGADKVQEFHFVSGTGGMRIGSGPPPPGQALSTPSLTSQPLTYPLSWFCEGAVVGDAIFADDQNPDALERNIRASLGFGDVRVVVQAWAIAYGIPGAPLGDRTVDKLYPTVMFAWGGDTEAMFQTMITEAKSGAILAQQDPIVQSYQTERKDEIVMADMGPYSGPQSVNPPFRDRPLYNNILSLSGQTFLSGADDQSPALDLNSAILATAGTLVPGGVSIVGVVPRLYYDPLDDYAQNVDRYVAINSGTDAILGGTSVRSQSISITGELVTNKSTFDARVSFSLWVANIDERVAYLLARSDPVAIYTGGNAANAPGKVTSINLEMSIGQDVVIPDSKARLMLRVQVWAYRNANSDRIIQTPDGSSGVDESFMSIDISGLKMSFSVGLECISNESYLLGSNNWYQNLPVSSARTFGSADYYFVADYDSVKQAIMPPLTTSNYGYWYLYGWMFSPFWFVDMPEGGVFEIQDRAGLTAGNAVTGNNFIGAERYHMATRVRTAIDTVPSTGVSGTRGSRSFGPYGFIARSAIENTGDPSGGNALGVIPIQSNDMLRGLMEWLVRTGETVVTGKNPLVVALDPTTEWTRHLQLTNTKAQPQIRLLFYEEDVFDAASHQASIAMLANYDGTCQTWKNPYGHAGTGGTNKVVMTNDMEMLGACVDPHCHSVYVVGFRAADREDPEKGGSIVMRELQPLLVFGTDSANTGPLCYVDGLINTESWNTSSIMQPMVPYNTTRTGGYSADPNGIMDNYGNKLDQGGKTLPVAHGFPDCFCDYVGNVYVFYTLQPNMSLETQANDFGALGKVYCRMTPNCGFHFDAPFPVADLGYQAACSLVGAAGYQDDTFQCRHVTVLYSDRLALYVLFFWAGGKVFMKYGVDPAVPADRIRSSSQPQFVASGRGADSMIYMVAGSTDFIEHSPATALDNWLLYQWMLSSEASTGPPGGASPEYQSWYTNEYSDWGVTGTKLNNYGLPYGPGNPPPTGQAIAPGAAGKSPFILINRFDNDPDVPPQRVAAYITDSEEIVLMFMDGLYQLQYKRIRMSDRYPIVTPAVHLATNVR